MAIEKFIHGKRDSCKHDGLYSIRKREQQADYDLQAYLNGELDDVDPPELPENGVIPPELPKSGVIFQSKQK